MATKQAELTASVTDHRDELERGERVLLFADECFLLWGDVCGYAWGKRNAPLSIPVANPKTRQAYYGARNALTGAMHLATYPKAEQAATTDFLTHVALCYPNAKVTICWDNASWHKGAEMGAYLTTINAESAPADWPITCLHFAPHDPTQNPIEEVWRQGKNALRKTRLAATTFNQVTAAFADGLDQQVFDFPKRQMYGHLQMI